MSKIKTDENLVENPSFDVTNLKDKLLTSFNFEKPFCGLPRTSKGAFPMFGKTKKGSFTDKSKYIPLYQSVLNLQQGKSISGSGTVNIVTSNQFEFPDGKVPKDWKPSDGLLSMDIADISQMQRELSDRISKIELELKSSDEKQNLLLIRDSIKNQKKVSDPLLASLADGALKDALSKYNNTIQ